MHNRFESMLQEAENTPEQDAVKLRGLIGHLSQARHHLSPDQGQRLTQVTQRFHRLIQRHMSGMQG